MASSISRFSTRQLINKTNQFNLTTRRYTLAEMEAIARDPEYIGFYGRLADKFGDNGLISVVLGRRHEGAVHMDLWLMSCRVLKRDVEIAMLDAIAERAIAGGVTKLFGYYLPTKKNGMVADFYPNLGFERCISPQTYPGQANLVQGATVWTLDLSNYTKRNKHIKLMEHVNG
jgi:FkbH-like protein